MDSGGETRSGRNGEFFWALRPDYPGPRPLHFPGRVYIGANASGRILSLGRRVFPEISRQIAASSVPRGVRTWRKVYGFAAQLRHRRSTGSPSQSARPWYKTTAQTYAGIMLWFVFWESVPTAASTPGGLLAQGVGTAVLGVVIAALICHFLFYLAPGMMGMKTGLPLAVVGTSTYGVLGGFFLPGFFMGILQFGWLAVNAYFSVRAVGKVRRL